MSDRQNYSVDVLLSCIELQKRKSRDYQSDFSTVKQADYYPSGIITIQEILHAKMLRAKSLIEKAQNTQNNSDELAELEPLEDTYKDIINYCSFAVSWLEGNIDGQNPNADIFNRVKNKS